MDKYIEFVLKHQVERTIDALQKNRIAAYYAEGRQQALEKVMGLLPAGCTVSHGGSMTLLACGIPEALRQGGYAYLDRDAPGLSGEEIQEIYRKSFFADAYLGSANAITENGEIVNVDGNGNRVAAYLYGPKSVILVAGINKVVPDIAAAIQRIRQMAAPANAARLGCQTPCFRTGRCMDCKTPARMCCDYVVQSFQRVENRIKVVLVGEALGF